MSKTTQLTRDPSVTTVAGLQAWAREQERAGRSLVYRGQANASWPLESTLYRRLRGQGNGGTGNCSVQYYAARTERLHHALKQFGVVVPPPSTPGMTRSPSGALQAPSYYGGVAPEYLGYLRQKGYPSPLLDWSESFYVALCFAFSGFLPDLPDLPDLKSTSEENREANEGVSLFSLERPLPTMPVDGLSEAAVGPPIVVEHPWRVEDLAHIAQHSVYTTAFCTAQPTEGMGESLICYGSHEEAMQKLKNGSDITNIRRFVLPLSELSEAEYYLRHANINPLALRHSVEAFLGTVAIKHDPLLAGKQHW